MDHADKKAAIAAYKERKASAGIYAVRCAPSGECWVGRAPDLDTIQNRLWFTLRLGTNPHRGLQAAWTKHGAEGLVFQVLERLEDEDDPAYLRDAVLKKRLAYWQAALGALLL